ncbi:MAG: YceI family protein [bacterium]
MKKMMISILAMMLFVPAIHAENWTVDGAHSSVNFTVRHMVISKVHGVFKDFSGYISFNEKNIENSSVTFTVDMASVDTDNEKRNEHLKSADFFDVEKYPTMTFKSTKVIKGEGNKFKLVGDLTIKDVTSEVTFDCEFGGIVKLQEGDAKAGFSAATTINRQDFHVAWSKTLDGGGLVVSDDVDISIEIEANLVK